MGRGQVQQSLYVSLLQLYDIVADITESNLLAQQLPPSPQDCPQIFP